MPSFTKIKTAHHILKEFHEFLKVIERHPHIQRIIPGVIHRQQKGSSTLRLHYSYPITTGLKYKMIKGSTAQELFVICNLENQEEIKQYIQSCFDQLGGG